MDDRETSRNVDQPPLEGISTGGDREGEIANDVSNLVNEVGSGCSGSGDHESNIGIDSDFDSDFEGSRSESNDRDPQSLTLIKPIGNTADSSHIGNIPDMDDGECHSNLTTGDNYSTCESNNIVSISAESDIRCDTENRKDNEIKAVGSDSNMIEYSKYRDVVVKLEDANKKISTLEAELIKTKAMHQPSPGLPSALAARSFDQIEANRKIQDVYIKAVEISSRKSIETLQNALRLKEVECSKLEASIASLQDKLALLESNKGDEGLSYPSSGILNRYKSSLRSFPQQQQHEGVVKGNRPLTASDSEMMFESPENGSGSGFQAALDETLMSVVNGAISPSKLFAMSPGRMNFSDGNDFTVEGLMVNTVVPSIFQLSSSDEVNEFYQIGLDTAYSKEREKENSIAENARLKEVIESLRKDLKTGKEEFESFILKAGMMISKLEKTLKAVTQENSKLKESNRSLVLISSSNLKAVGNEKVKRVLPSSSNSHKSPSNSVSSSPSESKSQKINSRRGIDDQLKSHKEYSIQGNNNASNSNNSNSNNEIKTSVSSEPISRSKLAALDKEKVIQIYRQREDELVKALEGVINKCFLLSSGS